MFIDSNIYFNHWLLKGANFDYLFNFIENTNSELLISEIVCEEVDNKYNIELEELNKVFKNGIRKGQNLLDTTLPYDLKLIVKDYSLIKMLSERAPDIKKIPYNNIANTELVKRAIAKTRPFRDNENLICSL